MLEADSELPLVYCVGACHESAALPVEGVEVVAVMEKAGSEAEAPLLSVALITMFDQFPAEVGV